MPKYLILPMEKPDTFEDLSPQAMQRVVQRYGKWTQALSRKKRLVAGNKLHATGRVMRGNGTKVTVTDGPHTESKELIGGFWIIEASSYDEAQRLCDDCPHLEYGTLVIREVEDR